MRPGDTDLLTLKVVSESGVTWATVPLCQFLVFLGLSVLDLDPMCATDRQTSDVRQHYRLMPRLLGRGIITDGRHIEQFLGNGGLVASQ